MKRIKYIGIALSALLGFSSCADELNDELFQKFSYLTQNGWYECTLDIKDDNTVDLPVYFGVNGTSDNDKDIIVQITTDPDTLAKYNFDKYKTNEEAYYALLPKATYKFDAPSYTIPAGEFKTTAHCNIDLNRLKSIDIYDEYVLPLAITSSAGEPVGPGKYSKVLYSLNFQNSYSGNYTCNGRLKEEGNNYETETASRRLYAISKDECYFYAGNIEREDKGKENYIITLKLNSTDNSFTFIPNANNPEMDLHDTRANITTRFTKHTTDARKMNMQTTITVAYKYKQKAASNTDVDKNLAYEATWTNNREVWKTDYPDIDLDEENQ